MRTRYEGSVWNDRFLPRLTTEEIAAIPKESALLILPIASVEQHGNHLPVFTDSMLNESLIAGAMELLPADVQAWLLPPLQYGKSNEHTGFSGTFSLSTSALQAVLADLTRSMKADGWKKLMIINSHGGNPEIITLAARDARVELDLEVFCVNTGGLYVEESLPARELEYGIHGGALETSLMLAVKPEWVHTDRYTAEYPAFAECSCFKLGGEVSFNWKTKDISETGVIGDPEPSTAEAGLRIYRRVTRQMADMMLAALVFKL